MEYISQKWQYMTSYFVKRVETRAERKINKYDIIFGNTYKILSWEDNTTTLIAFLIVNFLFWAVVQYQIRLYGMAFFITLLIFLNDYFEIKTTGTSVKYTDSLDEICDGVRDIVLYLKTLRRENPSSFCIGMSMMFLFMSLIARNLSGYIILYLMILAIFFIPLGLQCLPDQYSEYFKQVFKSVANNKGLLAEEELIPFICNKDFNNKDPDLDSLLTDRTAESATNSFVSGISTMPSFMDIEGPEGLEEEDLLPNKATSYTSGEHSSDSDSEHREINFDSAHFNRDSSSEEEVMLGKGLKFVDDIRKTETGLTGVLSNFAAMGTNLLTSAIKSTISTSVERKNSSSDSEFEIINEDDLGD